MRRARLPAEWLAWTSWPLWLSSSRASPGWIAGSVSSLLRDLASKVCTVREMAVR
ncbi:hypothetical protein D3C86_2086000 [compost metagenome]